MIKFKEIKSDLQSFADDEKEIIIEQDGNIILTRLGNVLTFKLIHDELGTFVEFNNTKIPYRTFLAKEIARLDLLAARIVEKRHNIEPFIDAYAKLSTYSSKSEGEGLSLLGKECSIPLVFGTKVTFVTADAGHGKTVLLREFQKRQATDYLKGNSNFIFWHIDLQGRDLVRLNEAIMYDLGELRFAGLYYSSIITLIKHGLIILGIDGFDELAAEVGGEIALGSLSSLVALMEGQGVLIAASRRTFFNTQDYIKRTRFLQSKIPHECAFNELRISDWTEKENKEYLSYFFLNPNTVYDEIVGALKSNEHPLLTRPYLFTKITKVLEEDKIRATEFIKSNGNPLDSINDVIEAFVKREVFKWKETDKETGKPYLSFGQHMEFLSLIAQEMWDNQVDVISLETIQFLLSFLLDNWEIEEKAKPIIFRMAESHALLIPVENKDDYRRFDHLEFKNFFISKSLIKTFQEYLETGNSNTVRRFLSIAQLPDSVARYCTKRVECKNIEELIKRFNKLVSDEWKPTYLQSNIGTLIPFILDGFKCENQIIIEKKVSFTSLIFENKQLSNIQFNSCNFINISFKDTILNDIIFNDSTFSEIRIYENSKNQFVNVSLMGCQITAIILIDDQENSYAEYSPVGINSALSEIGLMIKQEVEVLNVEPKVVNTKFKKYVKKFLTKFNTTTYQYEKDIREDISYSGYSEKIIDEVVPILVNFKIIELKETQKTRQASTRAWRLIYRDIPSIFQAEDDPKSALYKLWQDINSHP
jgi:hypothetical protein